MVAGLPAQPPLSPAQEALTGPQGEAAIDSQQLNIEYALGNPLRQALTGLDTVQPGL